MRIGLGLGVTARGSGGASPLERFIGGKWLAGSPDTAMFTPNTNRVGPYQYVQKRKLKVQTFTSGTGTVYRHKVAFANWFYGTTTGKPETAAGGTITVTASCVPTFGAAVAPTPYLFSGASSVVIPAGSTVWSDWSYAPLTPGTDAEIVTWVSYGSDVTLPGMHQLLSALSEGAAGGTTVTDRTTNATATRGITAGNTVAWGPQAMIGSIIAPPSANPTFVILGDSLARGSNDNSALGDSEAYTGWCERLLKPYGFVNFSASGRTIATQIAGNTRQTAAIGGGASHAICQLGVNDSGNSLAAYKTAYNTMWAQCRANGMKPIACTLTPFTTSTDSWATTTNQTATNAQYQVGGVIQQVNDWMRAGADGNTDIVGLLDVADYAMSARNSMVWRVDLGAPTTDGQHPTAVVHAAMAAGVASQLASIIALG